MNMSELEFLLEKMSLNPYDVVTIPDFMGTYSPIEKGTCVNNVLVSGNIRFSIDWDENGNITETENVSDDILRCLKLYFPIK